MVHDLNFLRVKAGGGPGMAVLLAVKPQHDLRVESKSNPPMNTLVFLWTLS